MHYYQFNIGDYASHTRYLTAMQDLIYRRLLDIYYLHEKPIPLNNPALCIGLNECLTDVERVLNEFFVLTDDGWINKRADQQIAEYKSKQKSASNAGKKSAEVRKANKDNANEQTLNECSTDVQLNINHKPLTIKHKPLTNIKDIEAKASKAKSTRLSQDWELPDEWAIWCKENRKDLNPNQVAEQFKDYWLSVPHSKGLKADWLATWRNWCRNQKASTKQVSFAEQDEFNRRRKWEEMTGLQWPDNNEIIDTPRFIGIEQ